MKTFKDYTEQKIVKEMIYDKMMGFMEMFDTTYPLNTLFWVLYFLLVPSLVVRY